MTVLVTWSLTNGGSTIEDDVDHGGAGNNEATAAQTIYVRHDGDNPITECKFFITSIDERYEGDFTAAGDLEEIISWGDSALAAGFGGLMLNLDATSSFPAASWPTVSSKSVLSGSVVIGDVFRTGVGDSASNGIVLPTVMGCSSSGTVQTGTAPNVRFQCKFSFPQNEDTEGTRHIKQVFSYNYTS